MFAGTFIASKTNPLALTPFVVEDKPGNTCSSRNNPQKGHTLLTTKRCQLRV